MDYLVLMQFESRKSKGTGDWHQREGRSASSTVQIVVLWEFMTLGTSLCRVVFCCGLLQAADETGQTKMGFGCQQSLTRVQWSSCGT